MNKEKLTAILGKLAIALGIEAEVNVPAIEVAPETKLAEDEIVPDATEPAKEEGETENEELAKLQEAMAQMEDRVKTLEAELAATKDAKETTEAEVTELKAQLSQIESTPADTKVV